MNSILRFLVCALYTHSNEWDDKLKKLLEDPYHTKHAKLNYNIDGKYLTMSLGGCDVWVKNWPYAYGEHGGYQPSVKTMIKLRKLEKSLSGKDLSTNIFKSEE